MAASSLYGRALTGWIDIVRRRAPMVVLVALALTAVALVYTLDTLVINTSTTDMISPDVPFRRNDLAFDRAFPQFDDLIVAVIDGATAEGVEAAAEQLAERLRNGIPGEVALGVSLVKRVRDLLLGLPRLASWKLAEASRLITPRRT